MNIVESLVLFTASLSISYISIPYIIKICRKHNLYDIVNDRKIHNDKIGRLGGLAIFMGFAIPFLYLVIVNFDVKFNVLLFSMAAVLAFLTGFIDDITYIRARKKLLMQILVGLMVSLSGLGITKITLYEGIHVYFGVLSHVITICWVVMFMNAINLLDGMDGLASGIVLIATIFICVISLMLGNVIVALVSIILAGSILGFYLFNFPPAKIFMGDGGAYFLGFMYAVLPLMGIKKASVVTLFLIPLVLLLIPLVDIVQVIHNRVRNGYHIFLADKSHIHHRLLHMGMSPRGILAILYGYTILLGFAALLMLNMKPHQSLGLGALLVGITLVSVYVLGRAEDSNGAILKNTKHEEDKRKTA